MSAISCTCGKCEACARWNKPAGAAKAPADRMLHNTARALCKRASEDCGVDFEDNWKLYGESFIADARAALDAAAAPELLAACQSAAQWLQGWASADRELSVLRAAIEKATGSAS